MKTLRWLALAQVERREARLALAASSNSTEGLSHDAGSGAPRSMRQHAGLLTVLLASCAAVEPRPALPEPEMTVSIPQSTAITIVRVKAPWWAPKFLITGRFVDSIPEYAAAPGLIHKAYTFSDSGEFGGVYLWDSRASAERWFDEAWHERVKRCAASTVTFASST